MAARVSDAIIHDHREIESYYKVIINAKDADQLNRCQSMTQTGVGSDWLCDRSRTYTLQGSGFNRA